MPRPQFSIRTLLWLTLLVAAFFGGMGAQQKIAGIQATKREKELERADRSLRQELFQRLQEIERYRRHIEKSESKHDQRGEVVE